MHLDAVRRQHLQRAGERRLRKPMRILGQKQRAVAALLGAIFADGLRDGQDMVFVEGRSRSDDPRWPEVPKLTFCAAIETSGCSV